MSTKNEFPVDSKQKTLEEREQEYLEARKRILGNNNEIVGNVESNKAQSPTIAKQKNTFTNKQT